MVKKELLFPLAAAVNLFSVTGLLILAGLLGMGELAADIAIVQGAILAVFHSLSANARNIILATGSSHSDEKSLFYFRVLIVVPAVALAYYLANSAIEIITYLFIGLTIRKCCEWLAELHLANREVAGDFDFARHYTWINTSGFLLLVATLALSPSSNYFQTALFFWAILPAILSFSYLRFIVKLNQARVHFSKLLPHMGSTTVIGVSTYVFRVLIVILVGKSIAGQMFTAYALGGVLSSLYVYALGPTLVHRNAKENRRILVLIVSLCSICGVLLILSAVFSLAVLYTPMFMYAIGFSLIGGGVMILAQRQRLYILQVCNKDVFVPDALSNILLIGSIPFAYYVLGVDVVAVFFLWSAVLALLFYIPLSYRSTS